MSQERQEIRGARIVISGAAGQVGFPLARSLAAENEVVAVARFGRPADRARLEGIGVRCVAADLAQGSLDGVPSDPDFVLHLAVAKSRNADFEGDLAANVGATGRLLRHCRAARAFLHCSSTAVYQAAGRRPLKEGDPLGDNHRTILPTYSLSKIAAEAIARFAGLEWDVPVTIARLNVPYGDNGGWPAMHLEWMLADRPIPVHPDQPNLFNPIHEDDQREQLPALLAAAGAPATVVNWGGDEAVSIEEWGSYLGDLVGATPRYQLTEQTIGSVTVDTSRLRAIAGPSRISWRDGLRRMAAARHPEIALRQVGGDRKLGG